MTTGPTNPMTAADLRALLRKFGNACVTADNEDTSTAHEEAAVLFEQISDEFDRLSSAVSSVEMLVERREAHGNEVDTDHVRAALGGAVVL